MFASKHPIKAEMVLSECFFLTGLALKDTPPSSALTLLSKCRQYAPEVVYHYQNSQPELDLRWAMVC
jgi:hypothetical protein